MNQNTTKTVDETAFSMQQHLLTFLAPLLLELNRLLDRRLVRTFAQLVAVIIQFRHADHGLLLSELGGYLLSPDKAPAGTKRISNLLRSNRWQYQLIERFLWRRATALVAQLETEEKKALCLWDDSVLEKPESIALEGLCAVRSSCAARLKRIKPGYFNPPGGRPIFVPGWHWSAIMVAGLKETATLAAMRWWTTRGENASSRRIVQTELLTACMQRWGQLVVHVFDRGYAGTPWLQTLATQQARFVLRWPKRLHLRTASGDEQNAWKFTRGKRSWDHRRIWDARRGCYRNTGIIATQVFHPAWEGPLWLVVSRPGKGRPPWYLLTAEPIDSPDTAWQIVFAYARRWQVEMSFRFLKCELAMQSPRLWFWENRLKLLLIATLAYAFLLWLLSPQFRALRDWLLRNFCHRTGKQHRDASLPLYRLRSSLSRLWLFYPPPPVFAFLENSG